MTSNKKTIEKYIEGFRNSDHAQILSCLTDDVRWKMPGAFDLEGKEQFDGEIENDQGVGNPTITLLRLVEENNVVVAEGTVQGKLKNGGLLDAVFCDVFIMEDSKIKQLTSYMMNHMNG